MMFGYRLSIIGPPVAFKSDERPFSSTPHSVDDPDYPLRQLRPLTNAERHMSIDELKQRYPFRGET